MIKKEWLWINDLNKNKMENNKLIAEFMELSIKEGVSYYTDQDDMFFMGIEVEEPYLPFDEDWNWLMSVVEKIEDIECKETSTDLVGYHLYDVEIRQNVTTIHGTNIEETAGGKLFNTYNAVVEFIKQYNDGKQ